MRLPNGHRARVDREKIADYLLSATNLRGRSKAQFFSGFRFEPENWQEFAEALKVQGTTKDVVRIIETPFGPRYHVDGIIETPDERNPLIRTVWQFDLGSDYPRLITAHPLITRRR